MEQEYKDYLNSRSKLSLFYRNFYLYLKIEKNLIYPCIDIGCGIGDYLKFSRKAIYGVDINNGLISQCAKEGLEVGLITDGKMPSNDSTYNSAILDNVLEHIAMPDDTLKETYRVLNENARLIIGVPGIKVYYSDIDHKIFYDDDNIIRLLKKHYFSFEKKLLCLSR